MKVALAAIAFASLLAGCGGLSSSVSSDVTVAGGQPPTLPPRAVPYLPSIHKQLTAAGLARETQTPALTAQLGSWGFVSGSDRYFQGESKQLQVVDSRTLRFAHPAGASAFVEFMRSHMSPFLGSFPTIRRFASGARGGILAIGQECQCHLANPSFLAVVTRGATVTWLEINGPGATRRRLAALIARAP